MKVILLKDVKSLGKAGDVVNVSDGHARNFIFPQNLGVQATEQELRRKKEREQKVEKLEKRAVSNASSLAKKIEGYELIIKEKVNESGKLFAAVNQKRIAEELKKKGFDVKDNMIEIDLPIKETGEKEITINLPHGFEANIKLHIESK